MQRVFVNKLLSCVCLCVGVCERERVRERSGTSDRADVRTASGPLNSPWGDSSNEEL